jgi:uncharacterized membrane protein YhaH (DUF805 family)
MPWWGIVLLLIFGWVAFSCFNAFVHARTHGDEEDLWWIALVGPLLWIIVGPIAATIAVFEITKKRVKDRDSSMQQCPYCKGKGKVKIGLKANKLVELLKAK